jgi:DNA-binding MarR family transcriptional regulator
VEAGTGDVVPALAGGVDHTDFGLLLAQAMDAYVGHLHRRLADRGFTDLRPTFGLPLRALHERARTLTELARELGVSKQAAAKVVGELDQRRLIERGPSPADGRATILRLSSRGRALVAAAIEIGDAVERDLAADLGEAAASGLRAALERLARNPPWTEGGPSRRRRVW